MENSYPINTKLFTNKRWKILLYIELFGENNIISHHYFGNKTNGFVFSAKSWEVVVVQETRELLYPKPRIGDSIYCPETEENYASAMLWNKYNAAIDGQIVEMRVYKNAQRKPFIVWDEIILPEKDTACKI